MNQFKLGTIAYELREAAAECTRLEGEHAHHRWEMCRVEKLLEAARDTKYNLQSKLIDVAVGVKDGA